MEPIAAVCGGDPIAVLLCKAAQTLPMPIAFALSCAMPVVLWLVVAEWRLLGKPSNPAFEKQIERIRAKANGTSVKKRYRNLLKSLLTGIDHWFEPVSRAKPGSVSDKWFGYQPWTANSYEKLLALAFLYPFVFMLWGTSVNTETLGSLSHALFLLIMLLIVFVGFKVGAVVKRLLERVERRWLRDLLNAVAIAVVVAFVIAFAITGPGYGDNAAAIGFAIAFAAAFTAANAIAAALAFSVAFSITASSVDPFSDASFASAFSGATVACAVLAVLIFNYFYQKNSHRLTRFWLIITLSIGVIFTSLSTFFSEYFPSDLVLILVFLPLFNAPLDWLSLGVTRGLLLKIERGSHRSVSALSWALIDIGFALVLLLGVTVSSFLAFLLVGIISSDSVSSITSFRDAIDGGHDLSIGIWLILASTLLPTFLHFLVALAAFVSLPFSRKQAKITADQLQSARDEAVRRAEKDTNQGADAVPVDVYARRWGMAYFFAHWPVVVVLWLGLVSFLSYTIYTMMQWLIITLLPEA